MAAAVKARRHGIRDARLVQAARDGDPRAFELLYERHNAAILSFCRHLTGRLEDAEDAVQHTFLSAHRELIGSSRALELKPWLFTVARNRCLSLLRARRVREGSAATGLWTGRHAPPEEHAADAWGAEGLAAEVERREELRALVSDLGELPEPQRAALVLSELEALSHAQIAQVLDVDAAKVRSLVFQARSSLISTREARDTACGEIRVALSTLRGSSLRRRTLRRHVRSCAGCREFEVAVRVQRHDLALVLPVTAGTGLRAGLLSSLMGGGATGGGAAVGGAAVAGAGAAAGGSGGVFAGLAGAVAGSGAAQLTAVVAVAVTGSVGLAKAQIPQRLGITDRVEHAGPLASHPPERPPAAQGQPIGEPGPAGANSSADLPSGEAPPDGAGPENDAPDGSTHAPGQQKGESGNAGGPPGLARRGDGGAREGGMPPGLAQKADGQVPPGQAKRTSGAPPGQANRPAKPAPPGQAKGPAGGPPNNGGAAQPKGRARPDPPGQSKPDAPGQSKDPGPPAPAPDQAADPAKPTPPGHAKEPKPK